MDFASWRTDIMARHRSTYVLGGQATLFRIKHLRQEAFRGIGVGQRRAHDLPRDVRDGRPRW